MKKVSSTQLPEQSFTHQVLSNIHGFKVGICNDRKGLHTAFRLRYMSYLETRSIPVHEKEVLYSDYEFLPTANYKTFSNPERSEETLLDQWSRELHGIIQYALFENNKASEIQRPSFMRRVVQNSWANYRSSYNVLSKVKFFRFYC